MSYIDSSSIPFNIDSKTEYLDPEIDTQGNVEYKSYLTHNITPRRLERLASQMNWRMNENFSISENFVMIYILGVFDNGQIADISEGAMFETINNLELASLKISAKVKSKNLIKTKNGLVGIVTIIRDSQYGDSLLLL